MDLEEKLSMPLADSINARKKAEKANNGGDEDDSSGEFGKASKKRFNSSKDNKPYAEDVDESEVTNRLYVRNLDYGTSWQDLKDHFRQCGEVVFADIFRDERGRSKGCGIVEFETRAEALSALKTLNRSTIGDSDFEIFVREDREDKNRSGGPATKGRPQRNNNNFSGARRPRQFRSKNGGSDSLDNRSGRQVYVANLPYNTSWQDLKDAFRKCGNVIRADILLGPDGRSKGAGTVLFESGADAERAIKQLNEAEFDGRPITVHLDKYA